VSRLFDRERGVRSAALTLAGPQLCSGYPGHVIREDTVGTVLMASLTRLPSPRLNVRNFSGE
jgi:hypothetical protein